MRNSRVLPAVLLLMLLLFVGSAYAAPISAGIDATGQSATGAHDGSLQTRVSLASGDRLSLLLAEDTIVEAIGILAENAEAEAWVLVSHNYRDWRLVYSGPVGGEGMNIIEFEPVKARFIRIEPGAGASVNIYEVAAGAYQEVLDAAEGLGPADWGDITDAENIHTMLDLVYDWQKTRLTDQTGWISSTFHVGAMALYRSTGNEQYRQEMINRFESYNWALRLSTSHRGMYLADDHLIGQAYIELYFASPSEREERWVEATQERMDAILAAPKRGREDYDWCDALFMAPPTWMQLYKLTDDERYLEFIDEQYWDAFDYFYDTEHHLVYRDAGYFNATEPNGQPVFWGRGNGWVIASLARMLEYMPETFESYDRYVDMLREMSARLIEIQQSDGLWTSSLLYPERFDGEPDASGSAFFVYAMAWGINEGFLARETYGPAVEAGWEGLTKLLRKDGRIDLIQQVGSAPAKNNGVYTSKDYGYGAFLFAGTEMVRYYAEQEASPTVAMAAAAAPEGNVDVRAFVPETGDPASWTVVDDFESENLAQWRIVKSSGGGSASVVDDPYAMENMVLRLDPGTASNNRLHLDLSLPEPVSSGKVTLYARFALGGTATDAVWGLSDEAVPYPYNSFEASTRVLEDSTFEMRNGTTYQAITDDYLELHTWQELWIVADATADQFDVFLSGGAQRRGIEQLATAAHFRNGDSATALQKLFIVIGGSVGNEPTFFDDFHISPGENLTRPATIQQPPISVFADAYIHHPADWRYSFAGWVDDRGYPWVYNLFDDAWWWIAAPTKLAPPNADNSFYAWSEASASWLWMDPDHGGWFYDWNTAEWRYAQ